MNELTTEQNTTGLSTLQQRYKLAQTLATSNLLPKHFQNQPANVFIAMELAESYSRNNADISFFSVMQNIYVVHGNVGMSAKFLIALQLTDQEFLTSQLNLKSQDLLRR